MIQWKTITFTTSELKSLNQTSILTYEVTNNSSDYDANVTVTCVPKTGTTAKYTSIKNKLDNDVTVVKAKCSLNGTLTIALDKISTESVTEEYATHWASYLSKSINPSLVVSFANGTLLANTGDGTSTNPYVVE